MFQYEYEKRPPSRDSRTSGRDSRATGCDSRATGCDSRATVRDSRLTVRDWHSRPLPPRPEDVLPTKTSVPLKVWVIASASCFAVCGALVLATIVITRTAASTTSYSPRDPYAEAREPLYPISFPQPRPSSTTEAPSSAPQQSENDIQYPILEKLSIFKNVVTNRDKKKLDISLITKPQIHPVHDATVHHTERKIEKKDQAVLSNHDLINIKFQNDRSNEINEHNDIAAVMESDNDIDSTNNDVTEMNHPKIYGGIRVDDIPEFRPTLPDVFAPDTDIKLSDGYIAGMKKYEDNYDEYYNDENLYDDYMQSNTMTSYLIEKVQELHDWIVSDPDFEAKGGGKRNSNNEFGQLLKALNESLIEGNVTIIMSKLKDLYFGEEFTNVNQSRKIILSNSTNLLSFGILTLDVMLLHNIQLMAWESQETARAKMLKDPDVFAFNALFTEPAKVEAKQSEFFHQHDGAGFAKRQMLRQEAEETESKNILENVLDIGMSTARAAIHLGRAFKNTKMVLNQLSNRETINANIQSQLSRNIDANTHALNRLQTSFHKNDSSGVANATNGIYTDLDCIWLLYCKNLVATAKLSAPYGTMARINGLALRMLTGELPADRALDIMLYEVLTGWTELKCTDMFPRCSKANPATVVLDSILQPLRKSQSTSNRSQ